MRKHSSLLSLFLLLFLAACSIEKDKRYYASLYFDKIRGERDMTYIDGREYTTVSPKLFKFEELIYGKFKGYELIEDIEQEDSILNESYYKDSIEIPTNCFMIYTPPNRKYVHKLFVAKVFYERSVHFIRVRFTIVDNKELKLTCVDNFSDKANLSSELPPALLAVVEKYFEISINKDVKKLYELFSPTQKKIGDIDTFEKYLDKIYKKLDDPKQVFDVEYIDGAIKGKHLFFYRTIVGRNYIDDKISIVPLVVLYYKIPKKNGFEYFVLTFSHENSQFYLTAFQDLGIYKRSEKK